MSDGTHQHTCDTCVHYVPLLRYRVAGGRARMSCSLSGITLMAALRGCAMYERDEPQSSPAADVAAPAEEDNE